MQASNAPIKSAVPFAESGTKNTIPVESQIGVTPGAASFADGFPPLTMTPLAAGGVPPYGADFNGILNFLSVAARWVQAGGRYTYDSEFVEGIGGYPKGAVLAASSGTGSWQSLIDSNTANPDVGGVGWVSLGGGVASTDQAQAMTDDMALLSAKKLDDAFKGKNQLFSESSFQVLPGGLVLQFGKANASTSSTDYRTFPKAFTTGVLFGMAGYGAWTQNGFGCGFEAVSKTQFLISNHNTANVPQPGPTWWIALGR